MIREPYEIRLARQEELPALNEIERAAASLFREIGLEAVAEMDPLPLNTLRSLQAKDQVWVAALPNGRPVGFAVVEVVDGLAHLAEISVHPAHGRQGLGTRLIQALNDWARDRAYPAVTLSTFRDVPWNAPFYERLGFRILSQADLGPGLLAVCAEEAQNGLDIRGRVCMRKDL